MSYRSGQVLLLERDSSVESESRVDTSLPKGREVQSTWILDFLGVEEEMTHAARLQRKEEAHTTTVHSIDPYKSCHIGPLHGPALRVGPVPF